ncbi:SDR family NAD(P)-dependent oxidoreductase [Olivibacter domesticus]|uniref:Short chain dehydrogenase n=1 Tax=Olivibacter domesticus TaxID=407022 RepID=A0A1H7GW02_OLID1|nr:SDR family NAD(P)-dependent oxidoreductase [Olivibacter domesticus]SEK41232.1 short chain dehydrogenase [Olivibacter domesticus]
MKPHQVGNTTLVTGGSRGLGRDMAINIAKKGLDVVITYQSNQTAADSVVSEIKKMGQKALALPLDVSIYENYEPFFSDKLLPALNNSFQASAIDYLIHNAGQIAPALFETASISEFKDMIHMIKIKWPQTPPKDDVYTHCSNQ